MTVQLAGMLHELPAQMSADDTQTLSALNARFIKKFYCAGHSRAQRDHT